MMSQKHAFCMDATVQEIYQARLKWLYQQQHGYLNQNNSSESSLLPQFGGIFDHTSVVGGTVDWKKKHETCGNGDVLSYANLSLAATNLFAKEMELMQTEGGLHSLESDRGLSRTSSYQIGAVEAANTGEEAIGKTMIFLEQMQTRAESDSSNKRKSGSVAAEECKEKRTRSEVEVESKIKHKSTTETTADSSKKNQKISVVQRPDYIHVRARRGQATDSHSLAERARRQKISKKMKCLQDLVPGCNKITGRAGMLDEIINYVQSLQRQVEFLSMKLAAVNPRVEFNINLSGKEFPAYVASFPTPDMPSTIENFPELLHNSVHQAGLGSELELLPHTPELGVERTINSSTFINDLHLDSSCFNHLRCFWDVETQNPHNVEFHQG
ncbi:hypothetical protein K2173_006300 [Erythroxylum novogranatense]|uniref:BHLH domain-containing protein n=1 Tax=Erythroxylum novogranatense TaxID=1862640 RepID=A0AAV8TCR8_9ROSI|nr:hypothetical protein K2173_006300 [Erythroxylum novogranatense]